MKKSTAKTTALEPQAHGGALVRDGSPGNAGGLGRPASVIRQRCREAFADRIDFLERLADGKVKQEVPTRDGIVKVQANPADRTRAMDLLGKYGGLQVIGVDPPEGQAKESGEAMMARVLVLVGRALLAAPAAQRAQVLAELSAVEATVEGEPDA